MAAMQSVSWFLMTSQDNSVGGNRPDMTLLALLALSISREKGEKQPVLAKPVKILNRVYVCP